MRQTRIPRKRVLSLVSKWKKKLKIENYQIEIILSSFDKYISKNKTIVKDIPTYAEVSKEDSEDKRFSLVIYDYRDLEDTIVHELLHIKFWDELSEYEDDFEHFIINKIIQVLL